MSTDTVLEKKSTTRDAFKPPPKYKVVVLNDDKTPMDFVVVMFMVVFQLSEDTAAKLMLEIHNEGSAVAGIYTYEVAEQKVQDATKMARANGYPLKLKAEEE